MSWALGKVSDIGEIISGFAFKSEWFGVGNAKVIRIGDLQDGRVDLAGAEIFDESAHQVREQFKIRNGDILMALSGATVGKIAVADASIDGAYLNQRVAVVRGKCPTNTEYLKYVFSGNLLQKLLINAGGAAQPNLSPKDLGDMEIPLPPLEEQKRIAAILDKADAIRRKRQQAIKLADDFLRSVFLEMFGDPVTNPKGWEVKRCSDVSRQVTVGLVIRPASYYVDSGVPAIRSLNIKDTGINKSNFVYFSQEANDTVLAKSKVFEGDLVIVRSGQPGKAAVITKDLDGANAIDVLILRPLAQIFDSNYLAYFFNSGAAKNIVMTEERGQIQKHLNVGSLSVAEIPVPPLELQKKFIKIFNKIRNSFSYVDDNCHERLFSSLSQKVFSGKL